MTLSAFRIAAICLAVFLVPIGAMPANEQTPPSSHEKAARELYRLAGGSGMAEAGADAMMAVVLQNPDMAPYEDVFRAWFRKVFATDDFESEIVKLYMDAFSEKELLELAAFYRTPLGQKTIATMPELMKQGAQIGLRRAEEHSAELEQMLAKARSERPVGDKEAQRRTVSDIRNVGTAMFSWLTDQVGAAAAGQSQNDKGSAEADLAKYVPISAQELEKILVPDYIREIPKTDGWGHPYEFYLNVADPLAEQVLGIRSPGRDGKFSATRYIVGRFDPEKFDEDIVWMDGFFVRWPQVPDR